MIISIIMFIAVFISFDSILGCDHASAFAAADHAGIGKDVFFGLWLTAGMQQFLNAIVFISSDHWLVFAFIPIAAAFWPFKPAVVKGIIKRAIKPSFGTCARC